MAQDFNQYQSLLNLSSFGLDKGSLTITGLTADSLLYLDADNTLESATVGTGLTFSAPTLSVNTSTIRALISATSPIQYSSTTGVISLTPEFQDSTFTIYDNVDNTKRAQFDSSFITTGTTRTYSLYNLSGMIPVSSLFTANTLTYANSQQKLESVVLNSSLSLSSGTLSVVQSNIDHGSISGLADDDHTQYHNDSRALTWLGTRSTTDLPAGTNKYLNSLSVSGNLSFSNPTLSLTNFPTFDVITASGFSATSQNFVSRDVDNSGLTISGGLGTSNGANIELYGGSHATLPSYAYIDASAHYFRNQAGSANRAVINSSGFGVNTTPSGSYSLEVSSSGNAYLGTEAIVSASTQEGGSLLVSNASKSSGSTWRMWNMKSGTGYGDGLGFWVYPAIAQRMMLYDTGELFCSSSIGAGVFPTTKIDAYSTSTTSTAIKARNDTTTVYLDANNAYSYLNTSTNHPMLFGTNNTERMRISSVGYLGIGQTAPDSYLHIGNHTGTATDISTIAKISGATNYPLTIANTTTRAVNNEANISFCFGTDTWTATASIAGLIESTSTAYSSLIFKTYGGSLSEKMRIASGGNTAIGSTDTSTYKLNVNGSLNCSSFYISGSELVSTETSGSYSVTGLCIDTLNVPCRSQKIGKCVRLLVGELYTSTTGIGTDSAITLNGVLPSGSRPTTTQYYPIIAYNSGGLVNGAVIVNNSGNVFFYSSATLNSFSASASNKGWPPTTITIYID